MGGGGSVGSLTRCCLDCRSPMTCIRVRTRSRGAHTILEAAPDPTPALREASVSCFFRRVRREVSCGRIRGDCSDEDDNDDDESFVILVGCVMW